VPVALVEPVQLADATVSRVTLYNIMWAMERGIGAGASIAIVRSHMVIPRIVEVLVEAPLVWPVGDRRRPGSGVPEYRVCPGDLGGALRLVGACLTW